MDSSFTYRWIIIEIAIMPSLFKQWLMRKNIDGITGRQLESIISELNIDQGGFQFNGLVEECYSLPF